MSADRFVLPLRDCHESRLAGGKAINLAKLLAAGFPVPGGFVVTTAAFAHAMGGAAAFPQAVPAEVAAEITARYRALGSPIVAVRSSATAEDLADASMAGQYETFLDIQGEAAVIDAVGRCWRSIDTPRTRSYLQSKGIPLSEVAMAVVVQLLVPSEVAGVLFTANPRSGRSDEMLLEASWGLGESVVSGRVQPDTLVVESATGVVRQAVISDKTLWIEAGSHAERPVEAARRRAACLGSRQVDELRRLGLRVQEHFRSPQDLEWGFHDGTLYLLQSRNITTMGPSAAVAGRLAAERQTLAAALAAKRGPWVRHNLSETLPHPTPLTWSLIRRFMTGDGGFGRMYQEVGFDPAPGVRQDGFLDLIAGRIYMDLARGPEMFFADYPFAYDLDLLRVNPDAAQDPPSIPRGGMSAQLGIARKLAPIDAKITALAVDYDLRLLNEFIPAFTAWITAEKARDLRALDAQALLVCWRERQARVLDDFAPKSLMPSVITATVMARLRTYLDQYSWDEDPAALADLLAGGGEPNCTVRATAGLREVALGRLPVATWLAEHGHRAPEEFDLAIPRWRERPEQITALAAHLRDGADPLVQHRERSARSAQAAAALVANLSASEQAELRVHLDLIHRYLRWREDGKYWLMLGYDLLRDVALEAGRRLGVDDGIFLLDEGEFIQALTSGYAPLALIDSRRAQRAVEARIQLPPVITGDDLATLGDPPTLSGGDRLPAFVISAGTARGPARIVLTPEEAGDLGKGYILVCPSTDPSWTPLFVNAAGLVMERGGALSHGAVVAREIGIPAVVLDGATRLLRDGEPVTVDGGGGAVLRGEAAATTASAVLAAADPDDVRIPRSRLPPPAGAAERRIGFWRNLLFLGWGAVLAVIFLLPYDRLYNPIMRGCDALLWPLVLSIGWPGVVTIVSVVMAVLVMVLQRQMTDNRRLLVAKSRAAELTAEATGLPAASPRRKALMAAAAPVQWRIMGASFVPLAVLLGPMIMSVTWLMERIDYPNDRPGVESSLRVLVSGEFNAPITLEADPALVLDEQTAATQAVPPIRTTLTRLRQRWATADGPDAAQTWDTRAAAAEARDTVLADLDAYLDQPVPDQLLVWKLHTPSQGGRYHLRLTTVVDGKPVAVGVVLPLGPTVPGEPLELVPGGKQQGFRQIIRPDPAQSPIHEVMVVNNDTAKQVGDDKPAAFFRPFRVFGWDWDMGWIFFYIVVYMPAMFLARWALRVA